MRNNLQKILKNESGASVTAVIIILALITVLGVVFGSLLSTSTESTTGAVSSERALYIAEAGAEAAIGHLNTSPASANWVWNDGYSGKAVGGGTVDVEVLQYDYYPSQTSVSPYCVTISSVLNNTAAKPARSIIASVSWDSAVNPDNLGIELYNSDLIALGQCASPASSPVATSTTANNPESIRYRIPEPGSFPVTVTYTVRVLGSTGGTHKLAISHPDMPGFSESNDTRSVISLGRSGDARREIFAAFRRQPC